MGKGRGTVREQGPEFPSIGSLKVWDGQGLSSSWKGPELLCQTLRAEAESPAAAVGAWKSRSQQDGVSWSPWFSPFDCY